MHFTSMLSVNSINATQNIFVNIYFYRPQRSCEGYVFTGVCPQRSEGGMLSQHALQEVSQHALQQVGACLLRGSLLRGWGFEVCSWEKVSACSGGGGGSGPGGMWRPPRKQMATVADGTHPTGMHSCFIYILNVLQVTRFWIVWHFCHRSTS